MSSGAGRSTRVVERGRKIPDAYGTWDRLARDLRAWVRQAEVDRGLKAGRPPDELAEIRQLRREVADQQRTTEILKAATTFFAREAHPRQR